MKTKHLRSIIALGSIVMAGLIVVQIYWFKRAFDVAEKQFDHTVQVALKKVADSVSSDARIRKVSSSFFYVSTNRAMDDAAVAHLIQQQFLLRNLDADYELGIYNAADDTLVFGNYVTSSKKSLLDEQSAAVSDGIAPENFAVFFPGKDSYLAFQLDVWIFSSVVLLLMMGFFTYAILSLLRERKYAELKNDFISNMTHEFKTPVTNIQIAGEIARNKISDQATRSYLDLLLKENQKLHRKIDEVLLGASVEFRRTPSFQMVDIHQLMRDCAEAFQMKILERNGKLTLEFNAKTSLILADRELLMNAINNIIDNAEKYSPKNPSIRVVTSDAKGGIEVVITDEGVGIPGKFRDKVFEKFFRVPSGDIHNVKGFGLGLNFVREVVHSHRGEVSLSSEVNRGTMVKILLPNT